MTGRCEGCGAEAVLHECRRSGVKFSLCAMCERTDVIGRWNREYHAARAA